jgi:gliding motility-associated-like protein
MTVLSEDTALVFRWNPVNDLSCNLCPNPIANPQQTTTYTALIIDQFGCFMANAEIVINVVEEYDVHIPTAFTPNTDGVNDWFYSVTYGIKELNFLRVYDRWGKLLFESKDLSTKWDGMVGGSQCPIGTYVWEFEGTRYNDRIVNLVGVINLIR